MAPGYEDAQRLASTKAAPDYWAKPGRKSPAENAA
jgi:hypothetical protein